MSTINSAIQDQFGRVAERYRTSTVHATGIDLEQIVQFVQQAPGSRVLDAGCGAGHVAAAVAPWSPEVVACDLTEEMLAQVVQLASERSLSNIQTRRADVAQLPFADATFDVVISRYSAHHWQHPLRALGECARVLKPGGRLLISDIVAPEEPALDTFLQTIELLRDHAHVRDHSVSQWEALFAQLDLTPTLVLRWALPLDFEAWVERMATPEAKVQMLKQLFDTASAEVRHAFVVGDGYDFTLQGALFTCTR